MKVGGWGLGEKGESRALLGLDCVSILIINHYCTITCYTLGPIMVACVALKG